MNRLSVVHLQSQEPSQEAILGGELRASVERRRLIEDLRELVRALDRRVPRLDQAGEARIARDAAALRDRALERIARLEIFEL